MKYAKKFGKSQDPYTLTTLVLLGLSLLSDVVVLPLLVYYTLNDFSVQERNLQPTINKCIGETSWQFSKCFFNLAISVNATRWAILILQARYQKQTSESF